MQYSPRAARAIGRLKQRSNDIEIYVEDSAGMNMWLALIRRIIPQARINSVTMLGGRDAVLAACRLDQSNDNRKRIYIIDGDFDYLLGIKKPRLKYLYRINAYCVENLLISELTVKTVGMVAQPHTSEQDILKKFDFQGWLENAEPSLRQLFMYYAICFRLNRDARTVSYPYTSLIRNDQRGAMPCKYRIRARVLEVIRLVKANCNNSDYKVYRNAIAKRAAKLKINAAVSGKSFLLPIFIFRLKRTLGLSGNDAQIKVQLAQCFCHQVEPRLCRRLQQIWQQA